MQFLLADREDAGRRLAERLGEYRGPDTIVLGIPRGGVSVAAEVSRALGARLDVIVPRKLPIPWSPEAGFGAILPDGTRVLNAEMVASLGLTQDHIEQIAAQVLAEVRRRQAMYRGHRPEPEVAGRTVILTDDGLATGYTMIAAIRAVRRREPREVVVAVPVTPRSTAGTVRAEADRLVALHVSDAVPFAVAMFYRSFPDLCDEEVCAALRTGTEGSTAEGREAA